MRIVLIILVIFFNSCAMFNSEEKEEVVARVEDKYLLLADVEEIAPKDASKEDSTLIVNNYIENWVKENLILQRAELNLEIDQKEFQKQLDDYRKSLIIYSYEKEFIRQKLDTNVNEAEIVSFYEENPQNFELKDDIVKVRYLKVNKSAPQIKKIRKIYKSTKEEDIIKLKEYSHQFAEKFHLNDEQWILFDALTKEVPIKVNQQSNFLKNVKHLEAEDSLSYYFVFIKDYKLEKDVAPLNFEKRNIKNIIINKRKLSLINKVKNELYQNALYNNDIEIYGLTKSNK
jgi:hypothetical protein